MKYAIDESTLDRLADAIREVSGTDRKYTATEMIEAVSTILEQGIYILIDENGNEIPAVFVESDTTFTATANDIRLGKTAAINTGVVEGTKEIPTYRAEEGAVFIDNGSAMDICVFSDMCEYTTLQAIVCEYNTSMHDSVSAEKVVIENAVYNVSSTTALSEVSVDSSTQTIKLGLTNANEAGLLVRYMIIKEDV